jgi:hypothetical protein
MPSISRFGDFEVHVAYELDMSVDRGGLVQHFVYINAAWSFEVRQSQEPVAAQDAQGSAH